MSLGLGQWIALAGFVCVAVIFITEVRRWRSRTSVVGRRQRVIRTILAMLIELLFAMMFAGPLLVSKGNPIIELVYWTFCVLLALMIIVLAMFDLRTVAQGYASLNRRMLDDFREDDRR